MPSKAGGGADIRSFFGGGSQKSQDKPSSQKPEPTSKAKRGGKRKVISDDEDEEPPSKKATPKKAAPKKAPKPESPTGVEVSSSDYFGGKKKPARSAAVKKEAAPKTPQQSPAKARSTAGSARSTRTSARNAATKSYVDLDDDDDVKMLKDDEDSGEDVFEDDYKGRGAKREDDYEEDEDEDMDIAPPPKAKRGSRDTPKTNGRKRKSADIEEEDEDEQPSTKRAPAKKAAPKSTPKKKAKKSDEPENAEIQDIFDSVQQVRPPTPPPRGPDKKFNFKANADRAHAQASEGTAEIPEGAENCLAGLTFVFTGILKGLGREEGQNLVKQYGGKVSGAPSKKTSFVVLGDDAGPKKLETIRENKIRTIDENGLFDLIRKLPPNGGSGKAAEAFAEKKAAEEAKAQKAAQEMAAEEARLAKQQKKVEAKAVEAGRPPEVKQRNISDELWTTKYAPSQMSQICGNKTLVEKLQTWLNKWHLNAKRKFKVGGPDGMGLYRAVIISGGPGIGKTTSAHLVAKLEGYDIVETNASDTRSKKLIETGLAGVLDTTSLLGYFAGDGKKVEQTKKKLVLIMDEVDGMSAGDRGGVGALAAICRKTSIPIILICNERKLPKMKPFDGCTFNLPFRKPTTDMIRGRIMTILFREGMKDLIPGNVLNALIEGTNCDIRQIINMLSSAKLDQQALGFDDGKKMANAWEKNTILKPWDITHKILSSGMFASSSKSTLNDKIELYFNDHDFSPLMLQENYLRTNPTGAGSYSGREKELKKLELIDKAAESISDGDLVDKMIHGTQQQWSLMPTHAVFSFVRPASFVAGPGQGATEFTKYLGNNSTMGKHMRYLKEIQGHMRLRASADRHDIRQQYLPVLWLKLIKGLQLRGAEPEGIKEVIDLMDSYYLTKEDWDAIYELGVGPCSQDAVTLPTQVKSNFTRKYNAASHPLPFMKSTDKGPPIQKSSKDKPDLEEAFDESEDDEMLAEPAAEDGSDEELDLKKDKYVRAPKKKKAPAKKAAGKGKKKADEDDEDDEEEEEDVKPKARGKAKAAGATKGKGKAK